MSNERLGLYEELARRRQLYSKQCDAVRRTIAAVGPVPSGAYAQPVNPFQRQKQLRLKRVIPRLVRVVELTDPVSPYARRRRVWPESQMGLTIVQVVQAVLIESERTLDEFLSPTRARAVSWPRQVVMYMIDRYCPEYSLSNIATIFKKDHTTVLHSMHAVNKRLMGHHQDTVALVARVHARLIDAARV